MPSLRVCIRVGDSVASSTHSCINTRKSCLWYSRTIRIARVAVFFELPSVIGYHCVYAHPNYFGRVPPVHTIIRLSPLEPLQFHPLQLAAPVIHEPTVRSWKSRPVSRRNTRTQSGGMLISSETIHSSRAGNEFHLRSRTQGGHQVPQERDGRPSKI